MAMAVDDQAASAATGLVVRRSGCLRRVVGDVRIRIAPTLALVEFLSGGALAGVGLVGPVRCSSVGIIEAHLGNAVRAEHWLEAGLRPSWTTTSGRRCSWRAGSFQLGS